MASQRMAERKRALGARVRARSLRDRASELCKQSDLLSSLLVENIRRIDTVPFGENGGGFFLRLPRLPIVVGLLRQELEAWLKRRGLAAADVMEITLACSEACANAIEHPHSVARQAVEVQGVVRANEVEVVIRDFGSWSAETATHTGTRGRGLDMIRKLMDEVAVNALEGGTQLTLRRRLKTRATA